MDVCPVCGSKMGKDAKACDVCGTAFESGASQCPLCGADVGENATECQSCGSKFEARGHTDVGMADAIPMTDEDKGAADEIAKNVFIDIELEELVKIPGVGPLRAKILFDAGYTDLRKLKQASVVELMNIKGIGRKAAGEIKTALREYTLDEIRGKEITEDSIEKEYQCPLCETIVSAYETSCYECGCIFRPDELDTGDSDRLALSYYDSKLLRTPDNKDLWYARGATLVKMGTYEQALNSFNKALDLDPSFQAAWMSKAEVYNKIGDPAKAAECYSHIITNVSGGLDADDGIHDAVNPELDEEDEDLSLEAPAPESVLKPVPEPSIEETEDVAEESLAAEESEEIPDAEEPSPEPEVIRPDRSAYVSGIDMDYVKAEPEKPDYDIMTNEELKKELSKKATHVKPYLTLAKEIGVDINHAKRLISRAVTESKQGELKIAVMLMSEAIEFAETEFRRKILEVIDNLASVIRDLMSTGKDVSLAADLVTSVKQRLEANDIEGSAKELKKCLELVEKSAN